MFVPFNTMDTSAKSETGTNQADCQLIPQALQMEYRYVYITLHITYLFHRWLEQMKSVLDIGTLQGDETISWAAYHASL